MNNFEYGLESFETIMGAIGIFLIIILIIALPIIIVTIIAEWKMFKKAGKEGWEILIPYYNGWVLIEIAGLNWWYFLISIGGTILSIIGITELSWITTIAGWYVSFIVYYNLAKKTKQNEILFGILGIIIPIVPICILGFSKNITFNHNIPVSPNGPIGEPKANNTQQYHQSVEKYCVSCGHKLSNNVYFCENCGKKVDEHENIN